MDRRSDADKEVTPLHRAAIVQKQPIFLTGGNGFVGGALRRRLLSEGCSLRLLSRSPPPSNLADDPREERVAGELTSGVAPEALDGVSCVVHLAALVHDMSGRVGLQDYLEVNRDGTLALARTAVAAGVKRFVHVSSVKVNGEATAKHRPFFADDESRPSDAYGISKMEAERGLRELARESGLEVTIIRPPLVYGCGVKANFLRLMRAVQYGLPLPFGGADNLRSLVALDNLTDFISLCSRHPRAAGETFLVSDGHDLSTEDLVRLIARAFGVRARLFPVPLGAARWAAALLGKQATLDRLFGSLQVDVRKNEELLGWKPPVTPEQGVKAAVSCFVQGHGR